MGQIQENREKLASVIGAKLANEFSDEQLPAMMHAIQTDEQMVRVICQQVTRQKDVEHPPSLILWKIRERKHTGLIPEGRERVVQSTAPPLPSPEELAIQKQRALDWNRIANAIVRSRELKMLYHALRETEEPAEVKRQMILAMDELNAAREAKP